MIVNKPYTAPGTPAPATPAVAPTPTPVPIQAAAQLYQPEPPKGIKLPPGAVAPAPVAPTEPVPLAPVALDEIMRLMRQPLPNKDALKNIAEGDNEATAKRLKELQDANVSKEIDFSKIKFITPETFEKVQTDPEAMNSLFQQFAAYIAKDTAEKISFTERSAQKYTTTNSDKLMEDFTTSQMIRDYIGREDMKDVLPYQDYYLWKLAQNRDSGIHGGMDLQQLMVQTGKEVLALVRPATPGNLPNTNPVFGGIGGGFQAQTEKTVGNDWSSLISDLAKNHR